MKLIIAAATLVVAIALGAALASASIPESANTASVLPGTPFAGEMEMLTSLGISPARASQALSVQREVAKTQLIGRIGAALGGDFAGVWFEPAAAQFHIGVISDASRRAAEGVVAKADMQAVVTYTPVHSTWSELLLTQSQWGERLASLVAAGLATTGIDTQLNAVSVTLARRFLRVSWLP